MPRPLRVEFPGAWHHVMNRGAARKAIFLDEDDRRVFIALLAKYSMKTQVEVHAYALMSNHFHLVVRTPFGNLNELMHSLSSRYARYFNDRNGIDGGLCKGRYKSVLIDSESHLLGVSRYVHRNPLAFWRGDLVTYRWSSYPAYLGSRVRPAWLFTGETLELANGSEAYKALVEIPWPSDVDRIYSGERRPSILGSAEFVARANRLRGA